MSDHETRDLSDVMPAHEQAIPDHHEHAKTPKHLNDDQLAAATLTGSAAMLSEAAHSLADTVNEVFPRFSLRSADRPADRAHPFGYGKVRFLLAAMECGHDSSAGHGRSSSATAVRPFTAFPYRWTCSFGVSRRKVRDTSAGLGGLSP